MYRDLPVKELLSDEDLIMADLVRSYCDGEIMPARQQIDDDHDHVIIHQLVQGLCDIGLVRAIWPEEYGGGGVSSFVTSALALEEIARGDSGVAVAMACCSWALYPAILAPNPKVLAEFAPLFCGDELKFACFNMTEPGGPAGGGGCDIEDIKNHGKRIRTRAALDNDQWVINGEKLWATNSGISDVYLMVCTTDPGLGDEGIALIYVPVPIEGFSQGKFEKKAGMQADRNCATFFENVRVPAHFRAAGPGRDAELFHANLTLGRIMSAAMSVGNAQGAFERVLDFTEDRVVGVNPKPIRQHSIGAGMLADMAIGIETARAFYLQTAYKFDRPEEYGARHSHAQLSRASIAKVYAADMAVSVTNRAMELMGSYGYTRDYDVEKYWRDCKIIQLWEGGAQLGRFDVVRGYYDLEL